jgi:prepilin-type N-terminal cleavage/methylation domain-containing protein
MSVQTIKNQKSKIKNGFTLLELSAASVLIVAALVVCVQVLGWIVLERRAAERRQWATQEVANVMEHLAARVWDDLNAQIAQGAQLSAQAREVLPGAELHADVTSSEMEPGAKRIAVELKWRNRAGEFDTPVRLTTWVYQRGGRSP